MFKHRMSAITNVLLFALFVFSINSCNTRPPILVGFVSEISDLNDSLAIDMRDGALMTVEEINQAGGIDGMYVLAAALEKTGGKAEGLAEAMLALKEFRGISGSIDFDEYGDVIYPIYIHRVINGDFETITTLPISK